MDVFELRRQLLDDYHSYTSSFLRIRDPQIRDYVDHALQRGALTPDPAIQLNPAFAPGPWIDELVAQGALHEECRRIFRVGKSATSAGRGLRLHRHQADAVAAAGTGASYVLTTGTGSGKSLAYIVPIVDRVLRAPRRRGITAIVVYPMNALANSQAGELEKFLVHGYPAGEQPVTFHRYTGQESAEQREQILLDPPYILLTNYVMLELILTRPHERRLLDAAAGLRFLVLDELHTYRGRQGADVALLVRRLRDACHADELQCVGTSATLAGGGTLDEQRAEVAAVATRLFGTTVRPEHAVGETLQAVTEPCDPTDPAFQAELAAAVNDPTAATPPAEYDAFIRHPVPRWLEHTFGVVAEPDGGRLIRRTPQPIWDDYRQVGAAWDLHQLTGAPLARCRDVVRQGLLTGARVREPETDRSVFAFRLHQFVSKGDTVWATLEDEGQRHITLDGQRFAGGDGERRLLLPLVFCRECGQDYYCVALHTDENDADAPRTVTKRDLGDRTQGRGISPGFLYRCGDAPWPDDPGEVLDRVPDTWLERHGDTLRVRSHRRKQLPRGLRLRADGRESPGGLDVTFVTAPFSFCLRCGVAYGGRTRSDYGKLASLGSEGRSTATTILTLSVIRSLRNDPDPALSQAARKLLSFTDNRQDASLQAGHFNDFVAIGRLRAALYRACATAGPDGLTHDVLAQRVAEALALPFAEFAGDEHVRFAGARQTERALREVLTYLLYLDLRRGWRVTAPNLEQTGLLRIAYEALDELAEAEDIWQRTHPALSAAPPQTRAEVARVLLDELRRNLAINVGVLDRDQQESIQRQSEQWLRDPWALDEQERLQYASVAYPRSVAPDDERGDLYLSARGAYGIYLRRPTTFPHLDTQPTVDETQGIIVDLLQALHEGGLVEVVATGRGEDGYQLRAAGMRWMAGDGVRVGRDPLRRTSESADGTRVNDFFVAFYRRMAGELGHLEAREHTAQVPAEVREEREQRFRDGDLPVLYCSPTMELGVDIAQLNVVNLRNVPPTPANYAQRSGRAGRSGQPALVFTYCTAGSPHDQYFFRRSHQMVGGAVTPPRLELANEDLVRAHVHAVWLAETGLSLGRSLSDVLDVAGHAPTLELLPEVREDIEDPQARQRARGRAQQVLASVGGDLAEAVWYDEGWTGRVLDGAALAFDRACDRWRTLYRAAQRQRDTAHRTVGDASAAAGARATALRLRREAETQMELLTATTGGSLYQSDFYSYRYFASEGFLPGYSFPRLPLSAFIPGSRRAHHDYVSRPRFLAISEFAPGSVIYHEGARYQIHRVVMPVNDQPGDDPLVTWSAKVCERCGYLHPLSGNGGADVCDRCRASMPRTLRSLFRMENVITRRRERINSDEEERQRRGYELRTAVRFADDGGQPRAQTAELRLGDRRLATLTYGHAATLWRLNLGWSRRENPEQLGFVLDYDRGEWSRSDQATDPDDAGTEESTGSGRTRRVVPFVEDRRNCLLLEPDLDSEEQPLVIAAGLQAALAAGIQAAFQLEDAELGAEPLPDARTRRTLLYYEAAEGGAGVLRRLVREPGAFGRAIEAALEICHFDPQTGEDRGSAPGKPDRCEGACYDCLLSYRNQGDHELLDRHRIRDTLLELRDAAVAAAPGTAPREEHAGDLDTLAGSELERRWLEWVQGRGARLPSHAQRPIEAADTVPDFLYADSDDLVTAVYVDGPKHDHDHRAAQDKVTDDLLRDLGYFVVRFRHDADWDAVGDQHPYLFGERS